MGKSLQSKVLMAIDVDLRGSEENPKRVKQ